jgi:uncharacterized membrane protein
MKKWYVVLFAALTGIGFTGTQIVERITVLKDPGATLACDVNATLSCSNVLAAWQSSVIFGIPNAFIGAVMFSVFAAAALGAILGTHVSKNYIRFLWAMAVMFAGFATWFMAQTAFAINALCLWCIAITTAVGIIGAVVTVVAGSAGHLGAFAKRVSNTGLAWMIWAGWWIVVAALVFIGLAR